MSSRPHSAADVRLVPHYVAPCCESCGGRLVLLDVLATGRIDPEEVWWDEWVCLTAGPACAGIVMDWPETKVERLLTKASRIDEGETIPWE